MQLVIAVQRNAIHNAHVFAISKQRAGLNVLTRPAIAGEEAFLGDRMGRIEHASAEILYRMREYTPVKGILRALTLPG